MELKYIKKASKSEIFSQIKSCDMHIVLECLTAYTKEYLKSHEILESDYLYKIGVVLSGEVIVYKSYNEDDLTEIRRIGQFEFFGHENVYSQTDVNDCTIIASKKTEVLYFNGSKLISDDSVNCRFRSQMNINMLKYISQVNLDYQRQIELREIKSLKERIMLFLAQESKGEKRFDISRNRDEMARYVGATRPAVSKVLGELKADGMIDYHMKSFVIK